MAPGVERQRQHAAGIRLSLQNRHSEGEFIVPSFHAAGIRRYRSPAKVCEIIESGCLSKKIEPLCMDLSRITPQLLDNVLREVCERGEFDALNRADIEELCSAFSITLEELRFLFLKFAEDDMIRDLNETRSVFQFLLSTTAWELLQKGGYTAHFAIAKKELKLLDAEVAKLEKGKGVTAEQLERITSIIANIYAFFPKNLM